MYELKCGSEQEVQGRIMGLMEYNRRFIKESCDLCYYAEDADGNCAGGITAWRADQYIYVDLLFVEEKDRKLGLGAKLLSAVEEEGKRLGVRIVEVGTFGFQAPGFYEKQGYRRFAALEGVIGQYGHYFYVKEL